MKTTKRTKARQGKPATTILYPTRPLGLDYRRHGYSLCVVYRPIERPEIDPAEYELPADQRAAIVDERDVRRYNAGADIVVDEPVTGPLEGTTLEDPLTDDDKAVLVREGLAAWRTRQGLRCQSGEGRFEVDRKALRAHLEREWGMTPERTSGMEWSAIMAVIRGGNGYESQPPAATKKRLSKEQKRATIIAVLADNPWAKWPQVERATGISKSDCSRIGKDVRDRLRAGEVLSPRRGIAVANGQPIAADALHCTHCKEPLPGPWWCEKCGVAINVECRDCHAAMEHPKRP